MSRSKQNTSDNKTPNPTRLYINFSGERGVFEYWDGKQQQQIDELRFVVLDECGSVGGWSDSMNSRIYSNYFKSVTGPLSVKAGRKPNTVEIFKGHWKDNKENIEKLGGKYQTNIFALAYIDDETVPVSIQLSKSALKAWVDFIKSAGGNAIYNQTVVAKQGPPMKKGRVTFFTPSFHTEPLQEEAAVEASEFDAVHLQPFLSQQIGEPDAVRAN